MNIEKKCVICGTIWGLISIKFAMSGCIDQTSNPNFLKLFAEIIYLPTNIVSFFGILVFDNSPRELLMVVWLLYIIGTIFMGGFIGYLFSKIIKRYR